MLAIFGFLTLVVIGTWLIVPGIVMMFHNFGVSKKLTWVSVLMINVGAAIWYLTFTEVLLIVTKEIIK